ncbi:TadE family protein [Bradyrhizobium sacchari]|uniref:TadE-like protein n=1 Tax=Bradyrhizobium sacchari TaxID=1399419 RepID=A0A560JNR8_9BRAD|nr:TadE family protein [Bradyrhizobium sacchari]TWB58842.1 TadE-like protein [Bradyrhizobium sacchari]TWB72798.1 TadE-like protein [Bradyrhizobium sacchari]
MRRLDNRGIAPFEFIMVFVPLFTLMFAIIDLGRYAITMQSLRTLAAAGARAVMIGCYSPAMLQSPPQSPAGCTGDPLSTTAKQTAAPFLYFGHLTPTLTVGASSNNLTVTASQASFKMLMPIWGTALNAPSASTTIPF